MRGDVLRSGLGEERIRDQTCGKESSFPTPQGFDGLLA